MTRPLLKLLTAPVWLYFALTMLNAALAGWLLTETRAGQWLAQLWEEGYKPSPTDPRTRDD